MNPSALKPIYPSTRFRSTTAPIQKLLPNSGAFIHSILPEHRAPGTRRLLTWFPKVKRKADPALQLLQIDPFSPTTYQREWKQLWLQVLWSYSPILPTCCCTSSFAYETSVCFMTSWVKTKRKKWVIKEEFFFKKKPHILVQYLELKPIGLYPKKVNHD